MPFIEACILEAFYAKGEGDTIFYVLTTCNNDEETLAAEPDTDLHKMLKSWLDSKGYTELDAAG